MGTERHYPPLQQKSSGGEGPGPEGGAAGINLLEVKDSPNGILLKNG